jgi:hypothetical protein
MPMSDDASKSEVPWHRQAREGWSHSMLATAWCTPLVLGTRIRIIRTGKNRHASGYVDQHDVYVEERFSLIRP